MSDHRRPMHPTVALIERNAWANDRLLNWCRWQPTALTSTDTDVYGGIEATFNHILGAETRYLQRLTGELPDDPVSERAIRPLADLREPGRELARRWRVVLDTDRDVEQIRVHERGGKKTEMPDWLPLVQGVHHGDDHRAQIGTLLGRADVITPDMDGWYFGFEPAEPRSAPPWADAMLRRAIGHHVWATTTLLERCRSLSADELELASPGTRGSVLQTLQHLVTSDRSYLARLERRGPTKPTEEASLDVIVAEWGSQPDAWRGYLDLRPDFDATVACSDGWYPGWVLVLQAIHHGNEHRTHAGTVLFGHQVEAPDLDVWAYATAEGALRDIP